MCVAVAAGLGAMHWINTRPASNIATGSGNPAMMSGDEAEQRMSLRQMQFITAGGTRVIWTFTQEFE